MCLISFVDIFLEFWKDIWIKSKLFNLDLFLYLDNIMEKVCRWENWKERWVLRIKRWKFFFLRSRRDEGGGKEEGEVDISWGIIV